MIFNKETFLNGEFAVCPQTWEEKCEFLNHVIANINIESLNDGWFYGDCTCYYSEYDEECNDYYIREACIGELVSMFKEPVVVIGCDQFEYAYVAPPKEEPAGGHERPDKTMFNNRMFADGDLAVVCSTYEDSISFLHILKNLGYKWLAYGGELSEDTKWEMYKADTAYVCARGTKKVGPVPKAIPEMLGNVAIVDFQDLRFDGDLDEQPEDKPEDIVEKELGALMKRLFGDDVTIIAKKL